MNPNPFYMRDPLRELQDQMERTRQLISNPALDQVLQEMAFRDQTLRAVQGVAAELERLKTPILPQYLDAIRTIKEISD
jgi:hypothetical protein